MLSAPIGTLADERAWYPRAMTNAPEDLDTLRRDLARALKLIDEKAPAYRLAKSYYEGTRKEIAGSTVAKAIIAQGKETPISFAHIPVDVIADKIELASITAPEAGAKRSLETWWDENDLEDELDDWIRKAGYFGDYYAVTDPTGLDEDGNFTVEDIDTIGMSPLSTIVIYDGKTQRIAKYGVHTWDEGTEKKPVTKAIMYYDDCSVKLVTASGKSSDAADYVFDIEDDEEDEDAFIQHDGGRMLIQHLAIGGKPYGVPLHKRAWAFQDAIAKISANNLVNVDAQGLPSRWALLDPLAEVDDDIDDDFGTDGPTTAAPDKDGQSTATTATRIRSIPGAINMLRGVKQVGTFDSGDSGGFLGNLDWYVRGMAVACGIALFEFDMTGEQPSGESRRRAEGRANRKASSVKRQAGAFFKGIADTVLGLVGTPGKVAVTFNPSETSTDKDGLELVGLKVTNGVPLRQALLEAGYTDELVNDWYPKDTVAFSPKTITEIATALAALGNAKTLGAITTEGIEKMIPELFEYATLVEEGTPAAAAEPLPGVVTDPASQVLTAANAMGVLIRAGVDQEEAAARVGLDGLSFPNLPTTIRVPETEAAGIEGAGPSAPAV